MRKLIIVEDNEDNRLLLEAILGDRFHLTMYASGDAALLGLERETPAIILLDISLPGMDGIEILARLRGQPHLVGVPVIALTAHVMAGDREKFLACGFDDYVTKPIVDETILLDCISNLLVNGRATRAS